MGSRSKLEWEGARSLAAPGAPRPSLRLLRPRPPADAVGERRWFETHARAILTDSGAIGGTMSIIRDVSERKATENSLSHAALTDPLTGLPNRRALRDLVEAHQASGQVDCDCIALLDIDHFKRVNDRFGHPVGDAVLRQFAATASHAVRTGDLLARFGGEEFAVLFLDTSVEHALEIRERLRIRVAAEATIADGVAIRVTVSGGVAGIGSGGFNEAVKIADAALYRAKEGGRDRLAIAA